MNKIKFDRKLSQSELAQMVLESAKENSIQIVEALVVVADELGIEPESLVPYVTGNLKEMIRVESEASGMLKRDSFPSYEFQ